MLREHHGTIPDAVRRGLDVSGERAREPYRVRPRGSGGLRAGVDLSSTASLAEAMDEGDSVDALR